MELCRPRSINQTKSLAGLAVLNHAKSVRMFPSRSSDRPASTTSFVAGRFLAEWSKICGFLRRPHHSNETGPEIYQILFHELYVFRFAYIVRLSGGAFKWSLYRKLLLYHRVRKVNISSPRVKLERNVVRRSTRVY